MYVFKIWARNPTLQQCNVKVFCVSGVIHLEQCLNEDIYKSNANKCV